MKIFPSSFILIFLFSACKKNELKVDVKPDIYVAGEFISNPDFSVYWKNGTFNNCRFVNSSSMVVYKNDIYFSYYDNSYYKNGTRMYIPLARQINGLAVNEYGIYAIGQSITMQRGAYLWKNGELKHLLPESQFAYTNCIVTSRDDVYVAGHLNDSAGYWKNDEPFVAVCESLNSLNGISVSGENVCLYGLDKNNHNAYWKNGIRHQIRDIIDSSNDVFIKELIVNEGDVYLVGNGKYPSGGRPLYWKNDAPVGIGSLDSFSYPTSIAVYNKDVFVVGINPYNHPAIAYIWKNEVMDTLEMDVYARKIIVTGKN